MSKEMPELKRLFFCYREGITGTSTSGHKFCTCVGKPPEQESFDNPGATPPTNQYTSLWPHGSNVLCGLWPSIMPTQAPWK